MITPNDIETKVFSSSLRGYNKREVDEFLDQIMIDYQALLDQNAKMLERVHVLQKQVAEAKDPARMTQDAKRLMNDISASAEQKAEVIIKNAKHDAENIVRNAKDSTSQADEDAERLRRKVEKFKLRFKQMLEEEIDRVDDNSEDLLDDLRQDFYPTLLYGESSSDMTRVAAGEAPEEDPIAGLPDVEPTDDIPADSDIDQNPDGTDDADEAASEDEFEIETEPEEDDAKEYTSGGATTETIVIDKAALAGLQTGNAEQPEDEGISEEHAQEEEPEAIEQDFEQEPEEPADQEIAEEAEEVTDETLIIAKPEDAEVPEEFESYDDPDREEPVEEPEPEPETEEEQAAKYADYAGTADDQKSAAEDEEIDDPLLARAKEANVDVNDLPGFRSSINSNMDDTIVMKKIRNDETVDLTGEMKDAGEDNGSLIKESGEKAKEIKDSAAKFVNGLFQKKDN